MDRQQLLHTKLTELGHLAGTSYRMMAYFLKGIADDNPVLAATALTFLAKDHLKALHELLDAVGHRVASVNGASLESPTMFGRSCNRRSYTETSFDVLSNAWMVLRHCVGVGTDIDAKITDADLIANWAVVRATFAPVATPDRRLQYARIAEEVDNEIALARQRLDADIQSKPSAKPPRLLISHNPLQATLDGTAFALKNADAADFLQTLLDADGDWQSGPKAFPDMRPDRVRKDLPKPIKALIESAPYKGYRLERTKLASPRQK